MISDRTMAAEDTLARLLRQAPPAWLAAGGMVHTAGYRHVYGKAVQLKRKPKHDDRWCSAVFALEGDLELVRSSIFRETGL